MKIINLTRIFIGVLLLSVGASQAFAVTVTLTPAEIQAFAQTGSGGGGSPQTFKTNNDAFGASFTTLWNPMDSGQQTAFVGLTGLSGSVDWSAFDTFAIQIANNDEHGWAFSVFVSDGTLTTPPSFGFFPSDGLFSTLAVDLTGLTLTNIDAIFLAVSANLPIGGFDRTAEYTVHLVPIPAAVWLFGSGLGLLGWMRKRKGAVPITA